MKKAVTGVLFAAGLLSQSANASTYVYDYDARKLFLDGEAQPLLDFSVGSRFNIRFTFDGDYLSGDNWLVVPAIVYAGSRITFDLLPKRSYLADLQLDPHLNLNDPDDAPFRTASSYRIAGDGFSTIFSWNRFGCFPYSRCNHEDRFATFLHGWGTEPRESTYQITVSAVPLQSSVVSLLLGLSGLFAMRKRWARSV